MTLKTSIISKFPLPSYITFSFKHYRVTKGGDWTVPDLVKYLVSVQSTRQPIDIARFSKTLPFPMETTVDDTPKKFKASDLHQPLDIFRDLGLPIIDWKGKDGKCNWRPKSKEGMLDIFLSSCANTTMSSQIPV